jgi:hypothetical protein
MGRSTEAISTLCSMVERFESMYARSAPGGMINLGDALARAQSLDDVHALASRALTLAREHGQRGVESWGLRHLAEIAAHRDPPSATESADYYRQALGLAEALGMQPLVARCHLGLGDLHRKSGAPEKARPRSLPLPGYSARWR